MRYLTAVAVVVAIAMTALVLQVANLPGPAPEPVRAIAQAPRQIEYERAQTSVTRVLHANGCSDQYAPLIAHSAVNHGLEPRLLAGLVYVESSCHADAVSPRHSFGLAQINIVVWHVSRRQAMDPAFNVDKGAEILASYTHRYGKIKGLHAYNGFGDSSDTYSTRVMYAANRR